MASCFVPSGVAEQKVVEWLREELQGGRIYHEPLSFTIPTRRVPDSVDALRFAHEAATRG